ncbi:SDR family NAD(P)-dependent oxidoreductase [Candidatus Nesciobacter abundans]|uniref:SDR family oxidoreductase n=1 Tax=Candidatus Nesciobacter abundans TaxID=2601668 RepID=A0A5C0UHH9_9PROT|nr:3-oxoacyl-ACP reductase FabG [Candidatus Nesciobacter abundans]QEK39141.1 SDR family oxidoreductase [Candidatus Nesciobacter abundans]
MFDLTGKRALITGAAGGIGSEVAKTLKNHGADVFLTGTKTEELKEISKPIGASGYFAADLTSYDDLKKMFSEAVKCMGGVDILVHSAGFAQDRLYPAVTNESWQKQMDVNLNSVFQLTQLALSKMRRNGWGRVISMSSVVGCTGNIGQVAYSTSKAALLGMTKTLAREVAKSNITVNAICPGFIDTQMTKELLESNGKILENIPLQRAGTVKEVAAGVIYLASEESAYVTGTSLHINGGMMMC